MSLVQTPKLREHLPNHLALHIGQSEIAALEAVGETLVVDPQTVEDGRLQIVNVHRVFDDIVGIVIGLAEGNAGLHTAAGDPYGETPAMVIAAIIRRSEPPLAIDGAPELSAPDHQRIVQHAPLR